MSERQRPVKGGGFVDDEGSPSKLGLPARLLPVERPELLPPPLPLPSGGCNRQEAHVNEVHVYTFINEQTAKISSLVRQLPIHE